MSISKKRFFIVNFFMQCLTIKSYKKRTIVSLSHKFFCKCLILTIQLDIIYKYLYSFKNSIYHMLCYAYNFMSIYRSNHILNAFSFEIRTKLIIQKFNTLINDKSFYLSSSLSLYFYFRSLISNMYLVFISIYI